MDNDLQRYKIINNSKLADPIKHLILIYFIYNLQQTHNTYYSNIHIQLVYSLYYTRKFYDYPSVNDTLYHIKYKSLPIMARFSSYFT